MKARRKKRSKSKTSKKTTARRPKKKVRGQKTKKKKVKRSADMKKPKRKIRSLKASKAKQIGGLKVGSKAPTFSLLNEEGKMISLEALRGQNVILYFYPKDDTPGCTKEACAFRDNMTDFRNLDVIILGVSFDDQLSHQKFKKKFDLNFPLLSDLNRQVANAYGVYVQKNMYGNIKWGIERSTFVIDAEGRIAGLFRKVKVDGHADEVLAVLHEMRHQELGS